LRAKIDVTRLGPHHSYRSREDISPDPVPARAGKAIASSAGEEVEDERMDGNEIEGEGMAEEAAGDVGVNREESLFAGFSV